VFEPVVLKERVMANSKVDLAELFYKQKGRCYWCKGAMTLDGDNSSSSATREHLIPQSRGGTNIIRDRKRKKRIKNVVAACKKCNNSRGNMDAHVFRSTMRPHVL